MVAAALITLTCAGGSAVSGRLRSDTPTQHLASSYVGVRHTAPQRHVRQPTSQTSWSFQSPATKTTTAAPTSTPTSVSSSGRWRTPGSAIATPRPVVAGGESLCRARSRCAARPAGVADRQRHCGGRHARARRRRARRSDPGGSPLWFFAAIRPVMPPGALGNSLVAWTPRP